MNLTVTQMNNLIHHKMNLTVTQMNGTSRRLTVDLNATVADLKQMISTHLNVNPSQQRLSNNGVRIDNDDSRSLSSYNLTSGSTVALLITNPMQVFVKNLRGTTVTYDVDADETVEKLQSKIYNKERVPVDQQRLIYEEKQLEPGKKLKDYNIKPNSTIFMTMRLRGGLKKQ